MERIAVETTAVAVLADGPTPQAIANARGHLLETFVAKFLGTQGYGEPTTENLNVTSEGIEIDVVAEHLVSRHTLICECKAYTSNIRVPQLTAFIGKFVLAKADDGACQGLFVGLPRLTPDAAEQARSAEAKLGGFRYVNSYGLCELLHKAGLIPAIGGGPSLSADPTLVVTEHGLAMASRELDPDSRRAHRLVVWTAAGSVPKPILHLVEESLANGIPVAALDGSPTVVPVRVPAAPAIVEVQGSTSDFEYQPPAAPKFFVGRKRLASELVTLVSTRASGGVVVINAKSGWGKSSLSLRLRNEVEKAGGAALVIDSRTAERPEFVVVALERLVRHAVERKVIKLPADAAFSSLQSIVETVRRSEWRRSGKAVLIVFDQFENVFRNAVVTREFRNLAFLVQDVTVPITVAFAWKTDIVGWTEDHPYQLRDEIRGVADVTMLPPFGPGEVETLLRRLEKAMNAKLDKELRQQLREYSQGLPWLLKKLAAHILSEIEGGVTQEQLVRQSLNVEVLFEKDLQGLTPPEQQGLRTIARAAPVLMSDLDSDTIPNAVLESLLHQRLVVQVGERLDTYWDIFRDFLTTGRVAIEDSYVVRYSLAGAGILLRRVVGAGGDVGVPEAAAEAKTSVTAIFNAARELRLFGVLTREPNRLVVEPTIMAAEDQEEAIRARVAQALRRHKMHTLAVQMIAQAAEPVSIAEFATALPTEFPAVEASADSWVTYARVTCQWMDYAGLIRLTHAGMVRVDEGDAGSPVRLLGGTARSRVRAAFPGANPGPAIQLLRHLAAPTTVARPTSGAFYKAARDLSLLGAIETDLLDHVVLAMPDLISDGVVDQGNLRRVVELQPGMRNAFSRLELDPAATPDALGEEHERMHGAEWAPSTRTAAGKFIRAWARECGIKTKLRPDR